MVNNYYMMNMSDSYYMDDRLVRLMIDDYRLVDNMLLNMGWLIRYDNMDLI